MLSFNTSAFATPPVVVLPYSTNWPLWFSSKCSWIDAIRGADHHWRAVIPLFFFFFFFYHQNCGLTGGTNESLFQTPALIFSGRALYPCLTSRKQAENQLSSWPSTSSLNQLSPLSCLLVCIVSICHQLGRSQLFNLSSPSLTQIPRAFIQPMPQAEVF